MYKLRFLVLFLLISSLLIPGLCLGQDSQKPQSSGDTTEKSDLKKDVDAKKPLSDDENPLLIGKRNINKHQIDFYSLEKEVKIGQQLAAQIDKEAKFVDDPVIAEYVNRVGQNLVLHSDAKVAFTIKVIDDDSVNAFALPGGFFYVNKGLLLVAENESELACVMAHEIAHVAARHGVENASKAQITQVGATIASIFLPGIGGIIFNNGGAMLGIQTMFAKFGRSAENEADKLGIQYAWSAGYDPNGMSTMFEKLQKREKTKPGSIAKIFVTHPPNAERITKVKSLLVRFPEHDEYIITTSDFNKTKNRLLKMTHAKVVDPANRDNGQPKRPTLKRRSEKDDPSVPAETNPDQTKERPTLKRQDSSGKPPEKSPSS